MLTLAALVLGLFTGPSFAHAEPATTPDEQRALIEALSGVSRLGVGGLPSVISQRFTDSPEIQTTAQYLKTLYDTAGIDAEIIHYDPRDAFPYYFENTDSTYRSYFKRMIPMFQRQYDGLCAGTLSSDETKTVLARLTRVGLDQAALCAVRSDQRVELYIHTTVQHTTDITKKMLDARTLETWPNVIARIATGTQAEAGPRPICVIGAHMDSVAREGGGRGPIISPGTLAPGADDNGSGTAAVLTLARGLKGWLAQHAMLVDPGCDLVFAHFSGEEEGLLGSIAYAHLQHDRPIKWMINFDMIAFNGAAEPHDPVLNVGYDRRFGAELANAFGGDEPGLKTLVIERDTFIYSSDQIAFWDVGVPAISLSEQACSNAACDQSYKFFNPHLHTPDDVASILDYDYDARIVNHAYGALTKLLVSGTRR